MTDTNTGPSASFDGADGPLGLDDLFSAELTASSEKIAAPHTAHAAHATEAPSPSSPDSFATPASSASPIGRSLWRRWRLRFQS